MNTDGRTFLLTAARRFISKNRSRFSDLTPLESTVQAISNVTKYSTVIWF